MLIVLSKICYLAELILPSGTHAAIRTFAQYGSTLLIDDAERLTYRPNADNPVRELLLGGNRKGATIPIRVPSGEKGWRKVRINSFAFLSQSELLWQLHQRAMSGKAITKLSHLDNGDGQPACRAADGLFSYWDHIGRMPWQTPDYLATQKISLRANAYLRLHEYRWTEGNESFINLD